MLAQTESDLPEVPDKRYFTIGEVSELCRVKPHVLRYWEQEFPQLQPDKRRGNRRYYKQQDVKMVRDIRELLYQQGFTINGARTQLREKRKVLSAVAPAAAGRDSLARIRKDLQGVIDLLD